MMNSGFQTSNLKTTLEWATARSGFNFCLISFLGKIATQFLSLPKPLIAPKNSLLNFLLSSVSLSKPKKQGNLA
jgi:hypothetical protein